MHTRLALCTVVRREIKRSVEKSEILPSRCCLQVHGLSVAAAKRGRKKLLRVTKCKVWRARVCYMRELALVDQDFRENITKTA